MARVLLTLGSGSGFRWKIWGFITMQAALLERLGQARGSVPVWLNLDETSMAYSRHGAKRLVAVNHKPELVAPSCNRGRSVTNVALLSSVLRAHQQLPQVLVCDTRRLASVASRAVPMVTQQGPLVASPAPSRTLSLFPISLIQA